MSALPHSKWCFLAPPIFLENSHFVTNYDILALLPVWSLHCDFPWWFHLSGFFATVAMPSYYNRLLSLYNHESSSTNVITATEGQLLQITRLKWFSIFHLISLHWNQQICIIIPNFICQDEVSIHTSVVLVVLRSRQ